MYSLLLALYSYFLHPILSLLLIIILVYVVMSWLIVGGVVSMHNPTVRQIQGILDSVLQPMLRPIRRAIPPLGQLDLSVFVLALTILFTRDWLLPTIIRAIGPSPV
ncbi:MAG TPA: YggT family protein [Hyphomonas sp.]|nr:YggT family protein [Hyphomonas sp.]HRJ02167.1 YggT family protein [Hyphomonas sp.]HRK67343.1 YggT family protein [Hyphomonas sp.]